jgi:hypothetical protein
MLDNTITGCANSIFAPESCRNTIAGSQGMRTGRGFNSNYIDGVADFTAGANCSNNDLRWGTTLNLGNKASFNNIRGFSIVGVKDGSRGNNIQSVQNVSVGQFSDENEVFNSENIKIGNNTAGNIVRQSNGVEIADRDTLIVNRWWDDNTGRELENRTLLGFNDVRQSRNVKIGRNSTECLVEGGENINIESNCHNIRLARFGMGGASARGLKIKSGVRDVQGFEISNAIVRDFGADSWVYGDADIEKTVYLSKQFNGDFGAIYVRYERPNGDMARVFIKNLEAF